MTVRLVTADDFCAGTQAVLEEQLHPFVQQLIENEVPIAGEVLKVKDFPAIKEWQQVPALQAFNAANFPSAAVTSPGLVTAPVKGQERGYDATWRVLVGVYDRGRDYAETQRKARIWAALVRAVMIQPGNGSLGGIATGVRWAGEELDRIPNKNSARTIGVAVVVLDFKAENVVDLSGLDPVVNSTSVSVTARSRQE